MESGASILRPGQVIRPHVTKETATELVSKLYGLKVVSIEEFVSYDDRNFYVQVENEGTNPFISELHSDGYIFKVLNSNDSQKPELIDAHNSLMMYMHNQNLKINIPVQNIEGQFKSLEKMSSIDGTQWSLNIVRLLTFVAGDILFRVKCTPDLCYQVGKLAASIDNALMGFYHAAYDTHQSIWMLSNASQIRKFLFVVQDEGHRGLVEAILSEFERDVLNIMDSLPKGMIHGDLNEQNIIVQRMKSDGEWRVTGILDVGDSQYNCYLFELALATTYSMLMGDDDNFLEFGKQVIAGYVSERSISSLERHLLKICVETRYCQSLVMGAYTNHQDPGNTYVLTTSKKGWKQLVKLRSIAREELDCVWKSSLPDEN